MATRYYSLEFLGKSSANDICSHFEQCIGPLEKEKQTSSSFFRWTKHEFTFSQSPYKKA